ncbi:MAG TPA: protein phosphatase 2C domain-containing protein [Gemmatimonadales bacterium]|nr:protein phosphatase 2C domain-containing protein [Gemmatimonadales bacterium]
MPARQMASPDARDRKPYDDEIDVHGVTHIGKVRPDNQDHFLICALRKQMMVFGTSLPDPTQLVPGPERLAFLMMVADGVGGGAKGEEASRVALEAATQYVSGTMRCYYATGTEDDQEFTRSLEEAALQCSEEVKRRGDEDPEYRGMATTLTLFLGVWPRAYLLQVGDSRCYIYRNGELRQVTRDQTMAQELMDIGVLSPAEAARTRLAHTLSSSIGGRATDPVVTRFDMAWGTVLLLCSDGLTAHVSDDRIRERLGAMTSAKQVCEDLLRDALEGGGTDNVTIIVGRALRKAD